MAGHERGKALPETGAGALKAALQFGEKAVALVFLIFFDKKTDRKGGAPRAGVFFLAAAVGLVICVVQWASMLLLGFM